MTPAHLRGITPTISSACSQLRCVAIALVIISRRVMARAFPPHPPLSIQHRAAPAESADMLNVYAPDISNVYDSCPGEKAALLMWRAASARFSLEPPPEWDSVFAYDFK
jgi:hypothetical protein